VLLAKGDPTWWGHVQGWFIINQDTILLVGALILLVVILGARRRR
jgi:hypothetical protein